MAFLKIEDFFLDSDDSDMRIRVQTDEDEKEFEVPGHRFVLRRVSKVFKTMLESDNFKESNTKALEIKVKGDVKDGMSFLRYLYTRTLHNQDISSYVSILQTAHLYDVTDLTELCEKHIQQKVTPYSVCKMYLLLEKLATEDCLKFFIDLMLKSAFLIFDHQFHVSLSEETMKILLGSDQLNVLDERQAIDALWSWAQTRAFIENKSDKDYIKNKASNLVRLVRWTFITNATEYDPWCYLIGVNTNVNENKDNARSSSATLSLKRFSYVLNISEDAISSRRIDMVTSERNTSIQFSVNRLTFLTGLSFHVASSENVKNFSGSTFQIYVNSSIAVKHSRMNLITRGNQDDICKRFPRLIFMEFQKPVILSASGINTIEIQTPYVYSCTNRNAQVKFSAPVYQTKSSNTYVKTSIIDPDTVFTVCSEVTAIENLYYTPK